MEIRKIRPDERDKALSLMKEAFDPSYESIFFLKEDWCLVAEDDGDIVAGCNSDIFTIPNGKRIGYIGWLYTGEKARGKGLASKLASAMIDLLREEGCDDITVIIEGDNPSSFKMFADHLRIMPLTLQIREFGTGIFKVWKRSSHFLDTGYFIWHDGPGLTPDDTNWKSFFMNILVNTGLVFLWSLIWKPFAPASILIPISFLILRPLIMRLMLGWKESTFLPWDTYPQFGILSLLIPIWLPIPLGVYVKGHSWTMREKQRKIVMTGRVTLISEMIFFALTGCIPAVLPMLVADSFLSFYPFCGFQASRIKRGGMKSFGALEAVSALVIVLTIVLRYAI